MFAVVITEKGGEQRRLEFDKNEVTIGRVQGNDVVLPKGNVSKRHSRIVVKDGKFIVVDLKSTNGTYVNGRKITSPLVIKGSDRVYIGDFIIHVDDGSGAAEPAGMPPPPPGAAAGGPPRRPSAPPPPRPSVESPAAPPPPAAAAAPPPRRRPPGPAGPPQGAPPPERPPYMDEEEQPPPMEQARRPPPRRDVPPPQAQAPAEPPYQAEQPMRPQPQRPGRPMPREEAQPAAQEFHDQATPVPRDEPEAEPGYAAPAPEPQPAARPAAAPARPARPQRAAGHAPAGQMDAKRIKIIELQGEVHNRLIDRMDLRRLNMDDFDDEELREKAEGHIADIVSQMDGQGLIPAFVDQDALIEDVLNEALGLGPLEEFLADESVTEIMVNKADQIYLEREGRLTLSEKSFSSDRSVLGVIERIVNPIGRRIDESSPMVDARLKDGSRVNAIIPPLALKGPCLTIRKFKKEMLGPEELIKYGSCTRGMLDFLKMCVLARRNILISGGTGSGKTTTLNLLSNFIPSGERLITVEDAAELQIHSDHWIQLESRPPNIEGKGQIS
ncbi:MAG: ATPase, T2SS/T4P/T4SS family, partial [Polyangia bacterium]|nr:ATPase, T2SS/T4P/T4SS family [Polyangia bacterium]